MRKTAPNSLIILTKNRREDLSGLSYVKYFSYTGSHSFPGHGVARSFSSVLTSRKGDPKEYTSNILGSARSGGVRLKLRTSAQSIWLTLSLPMKTHRWRRYRRLRHMDGESSEDVLPVSRSTRRLIIALRGLQVALMWLSLSQRKQQFCPQ